MSLDWLAGAGLAPPVHERLVELEAGLWDGTIDERLLRLVRVRVAQLIGDELPEGDEHLAEVARTWPTSPEVGEQAHEVLRWVEQFVIDPSEMADADAARLTAVLDGRQCAVLTTAVAVFEALARTRVALTEV